MKRFLFLIILIVSDFVLLDASFLASYWLRFNLPFMPPRPRPNFLPYFQFSFLVALISFILLYTSGLYRSKRPFSGIGDFFAIFRALTLSHLSISVISFGLRGYITDSDLNIYSRIIIVMSWFISVVVLSLWRYGFDRVLSDFRRRGKGLNRVLIVGTEGIGRRFYEVIDRNPDLGYKPIGFLYNGTPSQEEIEQSRILGRLDDLREVIRTQRPDEVIMAVPYMDPDTTVRIVRECERADVKFSLIPSHYEILTSQTEVYEVAGVPIFSMEERIQRRWAKAAKRTMDVVVSSIALIMTFPLIWIAGLLVKLESWGPILFRQTRVGKGERIFYAYKVRSMQMDAEQRKVELMALNEAQGPLFKIRRDPRITRFGRFIRKYSIDELPQLINVLKGEMSLVGPRPPVPEEVAQYEEWQKKRFDVLPGITGLPQVSGRSDLTFDEVIRLDIYYIENWSLALDLQILLKTIPAVLSGRGAY
jgi:exopolysaccharide biosynthesis polyprenyl glycosylphosphotransferase